MGLVALNNAIYAALTASSETWSDHVFFEHVPANTAYPYVLIVHQAGGDQNQLKRRDPRHVLAIRCVDTDQVVAMTGMERLHVLLDDKGIFDVASGNLDASADGWQIKTSTAEGALIVTESNTASEQIYHAGHQYVFTMEEV